MEYTKEQLKAAYALNLCTVSVSQIIDYEDVNIMEQEYEAILNNLNLEQMPKDEALLSILKQILDTITFFRIQEGDKIFIEKEYQQKMKNAIWSAVPNIGMIVAGGNAVTMAISLASQVGIGYMNYRRAKAEATLQAEKELWQLERTAIEQFNGLRRELFDTAWRLSAAHNFPDQLRLTERQIKQYNAILMDEDIIRKYWRLEAIKDAFVAYPPFWYHFGNTANAIARSNLRLSPETREQFRIDAKTHFLQYRESNRYALLREDPVSASCALELIDLLDIDKDKAFIHELLKEAIAFSGRANDILQLAAVTYLRLNDQENAAVILSQLVNEQYNTLLNAQLLSSIYVSSYISSKSAAVLGKYEILQTQVGAGNLYPLPQTDAVDRLALEKQFLATQQQALFAKYVEVLRSLMSKYIIKWGKLVPVADPGKQYDESYYASSDYAIQIRKHDVDKVFSHARKAEEYKERLKDAEIIYGIFELLNELFDTCCNLDLMNEAIKGQLYSLIESRILEHSEQLKEFAERIENGTVDVFDVEKMLDIKLENFTEAFFQMLIVEVRKYIGSRSEMQDFAIAEENLNEFCVTAGLPDPSSIMAVAIAEQEPVMLEKRRFDIKLLGEKKVVERNEIDDMQTMISLIQQALPAILPNEDGVEMYLAGDAKIARYFRDNAKLAANNALKANTIAILDDQAQKGDYDLVFTNYGIVPVRSGGARAAVLYSDVKWVTGKVEYLSIDGRYENAAVDSRELYELIRQLQKYAKEPPASSPLFKWPDLTNPFQKK